MDDNQGELNPEEILEETERILSVGDWREKYRDNIVYILSLPADSVIGYPVSDLLYMFWIAKHCAPVVGLPAVKPKLDRKIRDDLAYYVRFIDRLGDRPFSSIIKVPARELVYLFWCAKRYALEIDFPTDEMGSLFRLACSVSKEGV
jgi:hypothetical protein